MSDYRDKRITIPFGLSLSIHAVLLGALVWFGLSTFDRPAADDTDDGTSGGAETTVQEDVDDATEEIAERIDKGLEQAVAASEAENLERTDKAAKWLETHSSEEAVGDIAQRVREAYGTNDRAYKPVFPRPAGSFDSSSMLPFTREKRVDDDGIERTHQTWVDKDGRTMVVTSRTYKDESGKLWAMSGTYSADGTLHESKTRYDPSLAAHDQALDRVSQSPLLRKLLSEAVLPVLEAKRRQQSKSKSSSTPESPPGGK